MWANLHLLFWLSLIPVLTEWIGEHAAIIRLLLSSGDLSQARARSLHPAGWPGTQAAAPSRCRLPAPATGLFPSVHKHVDDLCATAPSLCIRSGNAGDSAAWP
jgi:hypothetical protein